MKLLIVEDYPKINDLLAMFCRQDGYHVTQTYAAEEALIALKQSSFDLMIVDLMLPKMSGEKLIQEVRKTSDLYIMVISAKVDVAEKIDAISLGADDYMTKPFSIEEVMVRLKNVSKRLKNTIPAFISFNQGALIIKPQSREVMIRDEMILLTKHEYDILYYLVTHPHQAFSREEIMVACFEESEAYDRVIDTFIKNIRKKMDIHQETSWIKTHYGIGYQFIGEKDA